MEDGLVRELRNRPRLCSVLILVLMEDGLVRLHTLIMGESSGLS